MSLLNFDENFNFIRYFGSNDVAVTGEVLLHALQSLYMTEQQIAASRKFAASKIASLDIDQNGFVVAVSSDPDLTVAGTAVRCLNYKGDNISSSNAESFGDLEVLKDYANIFSDVSVDRENFYTLFDEKYGRIFVYSEKGILVSAFGGTGNKVGMFTSPIAVENIDLFIRFLKFSFF